MLNERDIELIHEMANMQGANSVSEIRRLKQAWVFAKILCHREDGYGLQTQESVLLATRFIATYIKPEAGSEYALVPRSFGPGKQLALHPDLIPRAMEQFADVYANCLFIPHALVHEEFQKIHPFLDGNGRIGDLLWKMYVVKMGDEWPTTHPPEFQSGREEE